MTLVLVLPPLFDLIMKQCRADKPVHRAPFALQIRPVWLDVRQAITAVWRMGLKGYVVTASDVQL